MSLALCEGGPVVVRLTRSLIGRWSGRLVVVIVAASLVAGAAIALRASQADARRGVSDRFATHAGLAANFVGTFVRQLTARETAVATSTLTGTDPTVAFNSDVGAFGFPAAVLLDAKGEALAVSPPAPAVVGTQLSSRYAHLAAAVGGRVAVSDVVPSAAKREPVVAFAVPFDTPTGRRVFSGAYAISQTPLSAFLDDTTTLSGAQLYIDDGTGIVLATNGPPATSAQTLTQRNPNLAAVAAAKLRGTYAIGSTSYTFARSPIPGTPWTIIVAVPTGQLFASVDGVSLWLPWLILVVLSLLIGMAGWLSVRVLAGRVRLAQINVELGNAARTDALTGLSNRRHLTEQLTYQLVNSRRYGFPLCVLMIDIDFFKSVNDTWGHQAGDDAIRHVAYEISDALRDGDLLARWGGDEFLAVLPYTDVEDGMAVAQRLCALVAKTPIRMGTPRQLVEIHTSIGIAQHEGESIDALIDRADTALYEAKSAGRNTVRQAVREPAVV
jgi:diguanylate cyclase (GGDEF)-like protein